jgi:hypothetical protein
MMLRVGDVVSWRHAWGADRPRPATVKTIEVTDGGKYGCHVTEIPWSEATGRNIVVTFTDQDPWAYGGQLSPLNTAEDIQRLAREVAR